jgi:hypothetical protein
MLRVVLPNREPAGNSFEGDCAQLIQADEQLLPVPKHHVPFVCNSTWVLTDFTRLPRADAVPAEFPAFVICPASG